MIFRALKIIVSILPRLPWRYLTTLDRGNIKMVVFFIVARFISGKPNWIVDLQVKKEATCRNFFYGSFKAVDSFQVGF